MAKVKIKVTRANKDGVDRGMILIDDRVLPFENGDDLNIYVNADQTYGVTVYCQGPRGASTTASIEKSSGKIIEPLTALVDNDYGVNHASDEFKVAGS
ncbi:MAG: hypothetical protein ACK519_01885 [Sphingomonadaceae bacterium]|jgi:hypothetical protein